MRKDKNSLDTRDGTSMPGCIVRAVHKPRCPYYPDIAKSHLRSMKLINTKHALILLTKRDSMGTPKLTSMSVVAQDCRMAHEACNRPCAGQIGKYFRLPAAVAPAKVPWRWPRLGTWPGPWAWFRSISAVRGERPLLWGRHADFPLASCSNSPRSGAALSSRGEAWMPDVLALCRLKDEFAAFTCPHAIAAPQFASSLPPG